MLKVKIIQSLAGPAVSYDAGAEYELDNELAVRLVERGMAEPAAGVTQQAYKKACAAAKRARDKREKTRDEIERQARAAELRAEADALVARSQELMTQADALDQPMPDGED